MRKLLVFVFLCLCFSLAANAQSITLDEAYANWKVGASSNLRNESIRYCLASWVKRVDGNKVSMELIAYGQISNFQLRLTPLNVERDKDLNVLKETKTGETSTVSQSGPFQKSRAELNVVIPVEKNSNSIRIEWNFVSNGKKFSQSHIISLENEPGIDFLAVTLPDEKK